MASNYTEHYDLCQWEATDQVQRTDFNADNAKVDAALDALAGQVAEKADGDDLAALSETVAEVSAGMGNCDMELLTYTGGGGGSPKMITFSQVPDMYLVAGDLAFIMGQGGKATAILTCKDATYSESFVNEVDVTWNGATLTLSNGVDARYQMSSKNKPYWVLGLKQKN